MTPHPTLASRRLFAAVLTAACAVGEAHATWSVATLNPRTGTFAVAAASCSEMVYGIQTVIPGKGVVIVQAQSNNDARRAAAAMMRDGVPLDAIMAKITAPASGFAPQRQQYALLSRDDPRPRSYTGAEAHDAKGSLGGEHVSVQVNLMASDEVLTKTFAALGPADWPDDLSMAKAVMRAMRAGAAAGGDRRCGKANSATAFIGLYRQDDREDAPWMELSVHGIKPGTDSGMAHLKVMFERWLRSGKGAASTRSFVVPAAVAGGGS
ncbi:MULTISPECIES: DUF1028 domain-containing protein [unclassified Lysobacter]|uniref:DUF1028 domain-containing protein n=1 Tax=unclassified Lysobacter TaxID=2635362 RepID=UPI001BE4EA10|nr:MULTISPECIES: DUF1028 domain-containing protein [unclassified Lysobacter]MBT2747705.1 DUF1028 domain-containing protein [Lysobacter sp. ISL-42]MBT2754023.1 DUF1028 domain-containing protein [Lysobacter sp. ISL-50]MBT2779698.1 DUF1028 domain-containing protein [Lysobacter sp. ISL-54]MBT2780123.1 DUF1028 domain-containing protein [Lysobacter sp. ISL-52]